MKVVYLASFGLWHELSECPKTNKETQLGFSVATATGQVTGFFSLLCKPQSMYNSNSLPCATMMLLRSALSTPAFSPALPFSSKNQDKLYLPGLFTALGSTGDQTLVIHCFCFSSLISCLACMFSDLLKKNISYSASKFWRRLS